MSLPRLLIYAAILTSVLGAAYWLDFNGYRRASAECAAEKATEAADAANVTTDAVRDAAARNQAAAEIVHAAGDAASLAAAEELAKLRRELDETRRKLREAYDHDSTADAWRHERIPDSVRRVLIESGDQNDPGAD